MRLSRADRSLLTEWWFTVDHVLLTAVLMLVGAGAVLSLAASPAVAIRKGLPTYYFVERHLLVTAVGLVLMFAVSLFSPRRRRRLALALLLAMLGLMVAVLVSGPEINGAQALAAASAGHSFQPSEFAKPAFVVVAAWLFAESGRRGRYAGSAARHGALSRARQPGRAPARRRSGIAHHARLGALFFLSGQPLRLLALFCLFAVSAFAGLYATFPHVRSRIARFLDPTSGDNSQTDRAIESFSEGGFFGRGPGEGTIKGVLPDAHTDFIFAVVGEEYGTVACLALLGLFAFVVIRALMARGGGAGRPGGGCRSRAWRCCSGCRRHQHGRQRRAPARQGHDAAVHFLGRLVDACGVDHARHAAGADAQRPHAGRVSKSRLFAPHVDLDLAGHETR